MVTPRIRRSEPKEELDDGQRNGIGPELMERKGEERDHLNA